MLDSSVVHACRMSFNDSIVLVGACRSKLPDMRPRTDCSDSMSFNNSETILGASLIDESDSLAILADLRAKRTKARVLAPAPIASMVVSICRGRKCYS